MNDIKNERIIKVLQSELDNFHVSPKEAFRLLIETAFTVAIHNRLFTEESQPQWLRAFLEEIEIIIDTLVFNNE